MYFRIRKFLSVSDLEKELSLRNFHQRIIDNRSRFPVVVIDDKPFTPIEFLRRHNYHITHLFDVNQIDAVARFPIVLCDLLDVGSSLNPNLQGAGVIQEIKKSYPEKIVVAYTGGGPSPLVEKAIAIADGYLKKDASIDEWCEVLDDAISSQANPATVWRKVRLRLLDAAITPYELAVLEDAFTRNAIEGKEFQPALQKVADDLKVPPEIKTILSSLATSAVVQMVKLGLN
jgi:DNA-binding NarL/FixJ family response regulator